jgi:HSP20 family protein
MVLSELRQALLNPGRLSFVPDIQLEDQGDQYVLTADLPGWNEDEIEVKVHGNRLSIKGVHQERTTLQQRVYWQQVRQYRSFERHFILSGEVQPEAVTSSLESGTYRLAIPKAKLNRYERE